MAAVTTFDFKTGVRVSDTGGVSPGEVGGIVAGGLAVLAALGKGIQWLLNWRDTRAETRSAKLQAWHDELERREERQNQRDATYQQHMEAELRQVKMENRALRAAFEMVVYPLKALDPKNPALTRAQDLLSRAFPVDPSMPEDLGVLITMLDASKDPPGRMETD